MPYSKARFDAALHAYLKLQTMKPLIIASCCRIIFIGFFAYTSVLYAQAKKITFEYSILENGLKIILLPAKNDSLVSVTMLYGAGSRQDPASKVGMAHLLEHMMFQGSVHFPPSSWEKCTRQSGGFYNGFTDSDFTRYFTLAPLRLLETVIHMEADRMIAPLLDSITLSSQKSSVINEYNVNIRNRPYGGFPWLPMQQLSSQNLNYTYNSYGSIEETETIRLQEVKDFHLAYYHPNNAVIVIMGNMDMLKTKAWINRYFGKISPHAIPAGSSLEEPGQLQEKRIEKYDPLISRPAIAIACKMPKKNAPEYFAMGIISHLLLKEEEGLFCKQFAFPQTRNLKINGGIHYLGNMLNYKDPMLWMTDLIYPPSLTPDSILLLFDSAINAAAHTITQEMIRSAAAGLVTELFAKLENEDGIPLASTLAFLALFEGDPQKINTLEQSFENINPALVRKTIREYLQPQNRTILILKPAGLPQ